MKYRYLRNVVFAGFETFLIWFIYKWHGLEWGLFMAFFSIVYNQYWIRSWQK